MIKSVFRKFVPTAFQRNIASFLAKTKGLFVLFFSPFYPKNEFYNTWRFIGKNKLSMYPFEKSINYDTMQIDVLTDKDKKMFYVVHNNKNLYFPKDMSLSKVKETYRSLLIEQDVNSPHRYLNSYDEIKGKVLFDIGSAEGIFALDTIEYTEKVYLFECEEKWIEPLQSTFEKWNDKVEIVKKFIGNEDKDNFTTIDAFIENKKIPKSNICIKMDIEGAEISALRGASNLLQNGKSLLFLVCTYHNVSDEKEICTIFDSKNYVSELTNGYLLLSFYLRRGLCRANSAN